jgi:excisionase family DNA binding protein
LEKVPLHHDELEALRLCDGEGLTQEQAGERMGVSRGTIQRLVASGRQKVIDTIVIGRALVMGKD